MIALLNTWFASVEDRYHVDPLIFGIIYLLSVAPCWITLLKALGAYRRRDQRRLPLWAGLFALFFLSPYLYVYVAGRDYPAWFHAVFAAAVAGSVLSAVGQIRRRLAHLPER